MNIEKHIQDQNGKQLFGEQPLDLWDEMNHIGVRSNYVSSFYATQLKEYNLSVPKKFSLKN